MLRASVKVVRWLAAALAAIAFALVVLISPQHPDYCHPETQGPTQRVQSMTQTLSPTTVNPFNNCPGSPQFNTGDYKLR
jgi:hypothetical protein